jgi:hypothetical protein
MVQLQNINKHLSLSERGAVLGPWRNAKLSRKVMVQLSINRHKNQTERTVVLGP